MQQSLTALEAIGFMNSVGREETPLIETPIYRSVQDHNNFFVIESDEALLIDRVDLEEAERDERWTWLSPPAPWVKDGVVLGTEDIADVESQEAFPVLRIHYCSRAEARGTLVRLAKAYLKQGLEILDAEKPSVEQAIGVLRKAYRSHPNAVGLLVLCWGCARLQRDEPSEFFECRRIADRLDRLLKQATLGTEYDSTKRRWLTKAVIDLDSGQTKLDFGNFDQYEHDGVPDPTSVTIMVELLSFCRRNKGRWSKYGDVVFAVSAQALLYELALPSDPARAIANLHLNNAYTLEVIEHGQTTLNVGPGLAKAIVQASDADVPELAGRILGAIARLTRQFAPATWDRYQQDKSEPSGASLRFAFSMAFVEVNDFLKNQPYNEIRNRSGLAKAAEHLGRFHVAREQALRLMELSYKLDEVDAEAKTKDQIIMLRHSRENIADACRQLGNWELKRGTADAAGAYFDMARERFLRVMCSLESEDFGRVGERLAYCTLKLAQITSDEELATESFNYYEKVEQWANDRNEDLPRWFIDGYKYAAKLSGRSDAPSSYGEYLIKWTATESEYAPASIEVDHIPLSMLERRLREIQREIWNDPRKAASAAAEIEESIQNNPQLGLFWIRTRGLRLQALVRTGGSSDILLAGELSDELAWQAESAETDSLEQRFVYEQLAKYFQRAGDFRSARHWNELLCLNPCDEVALMRRDLINARLAQTADEAANARTMLLNRAQTRVQYDDRDEAARLYFAAGEVAMLGHARWADPDLAEVEHCYRKAAAIRNPPHTAALYRLAWVLFEKGELREAVDQLDSLPIDDVRAAGLFVRIALADKNNAERRLSEAAERLEGAWYQRPLDRFLPRHVVDLASADPVAGARLCGRIIKTSLERDQVASAAYLCRALAARCLFYTEITDKVLKYVTRSSIGDSKFLVYLHASLLRTLVDTDEDAKSLWITYFKSKYSRECFEHLIKPIAVPVSVRALELLEGHQTELNRELQQETWPRELIASVRDEISTGKDWLNELRQVPDEAKRRSLNGVKMELVDGLIIGSGEFWEPLAFKSVISSLEGPRAIVIDVDLLRAVASVYCRGASKEATLTIADSGKPGKVSIEISDLHERASGRTKSEDEWSHYVVTDLLGGSLTENGLELPVFLSAGDV